MARQRKKAGRQVRLEEANAKAKEEAKRWWCATDGSKAVDLTDPMDLTAASNAQGPKPTVPPIPEGNLVVRLRSARGDVFAAPVSLLWQSSVVRGLIEDGGSNEEIPLPMASSAAIGFILHCCCQEQQGQQQKHGQRQQQPYGHSSNSWTRPLWQSLEPNLLSEVLWAARLLDLQQVLVHPLASLINAGDGWLWTVLSQEMLLLLLRCVTDLVEPFRIRQLLELASKEEDVRVHPLLWVPPVVNLLGHPNPSVSEAASDFLLCLPIAEPRVMMLQHKSFQVRVRAIRALAQLPHDSKNLQAVAQLSKGGSFLTREKVAEALAQVVLAQRASMSLADHRFAVETLAGMLGDRVREVRQAAAEALEQVAWEDDPVVIAAVTTYTLDKNWPVQAVALRVLERVMRSDRQLVEELANKVHEQESTMAKIYAERILRRLHGHTTEDNHKPPEACVQTPSMSSKNLESQSRWGDGYSSDDAT